MKSDKSSVTLLIKILFWVTIIVFGGLLGWVNYPFTIVNADEGEYSLRFYGHGVNDIDRVKIPIDPHVPVDVGETDFTIEWWMKANLSDNQGAVSCGQNDGWITGNIIFDRDIWGPGDYGDFGISLNNGRVAFGVSYQSVGNTVCGGMVVADGEWHHVAVTRRYSDGQLCVYVDGVQDSCASGLVGENRNVSYRDGRDLLMPNDPFLVIGAEKHDAGDEYPSYNGFIDEVRLSNILRYSGGYTIPSEFTPDDHTLGLYHLDEGPAGACTGMVLDSSGSGGGPSNGYCQYGGGAPAGPLYTNDSPFSGVTNTPISSPTNTYTLRPSQTTSLTPTTPQPTITFSSTPGTPLPTWGVTPSPTPTHTSVCITGDYNKFSANPICVTATVPGSPTATSTTEPPLCWVYCVFLPHVSIK